MNLLLPNETALRLLQSIPHSTCSKAILARWRVTPEGAVKAQSVLWLFCWAKTGMNSFEAARASREIFDRLLPVKFDEFDSRVPHSYARLKRYAPGDIETELRAMLGLG